MNTPTVYAPYFELPAKRSKQSEIKRLRAILKLNPSNPRMASVRSRLDALLKP